MKTKTSNDVEMEKNPKDLNGVEDGERKECSYEEALKLIGFGKMQFVILLVCGVILMAVINETMGMMIITIASQCDLDTNSQQKAILSAAAFVGIFVSSHLWGFLSDTTGRRKVIIYTLYASCIFSFLSFFTSNFWIFLALRFLSGVGISGPSASLYAYLGEFYEVKYRPIVINYASMFVGVSMAYIPGTAWLILPDADWSIPLYDGFEIRPWRLLIICNLLPGFIGAICLSFLPETPKYFLSKGRDEEALEVVRWLYEKNSGNPGDMFPVKRLSSEVDESSRESTARKGCGSIASQMWNQTAQLFKAPHLVNFTICCVVMFGVFFVSSGMGLWYPEIQNRLGSASSDAQITVCQAIHTGNQMLLDPDFNSTAGICDDYVSTKTFMDSFTLGMFYIIAYIFLGVIINPLGRKTVLFACLFGAGSCGLALHWVDEPIVVVVLFCLFLMLPGLCVSVLSGCLVDLIPTHIRGMAVCICLMLGRFGSVVGSNVIGSILDPYCSMTFTLFSAFSMLCGFLILFLPKTNSENKTSQTS